MIKKISSILPFITMLIFIPIYEILDNMVLVDVFGCGCVPSAQTNMFNIPFNANDLRTVVFTTLTIGISVLGFVISKRFSKTTRVFYCLAVIILNVILALWVVKTFMWK